jgi:hypothetical protein
MTLGTRLSNIVGGEQLRAPQGPNMVNWTNPDRNLIMNRILVSLRSCDVELHSAGDHVRARSMRAELGSAATPNNAT